MAHKDTHTQGPDTFIQMPLTTDIQIWKTHVCTRVGVGTTGSPAVNAQNHTQCRPYTNPVPVAHSAPSVRVAGDSNQLHPSSPGTVMCCTMAMKAPLMQEEL